MGIRVNGTELSCGGCNEVVYPDCQVIANHNIIRLADGRVHWWSRDFEVTVHLCALPPMALALEQASGLVLDFLASRGAIPALAT